MAKYETKFTDNTDITDYLATGYAEGFEQAPNEKDLVKAWSYLIGTKLAFSLQGFFGRQAQSLIDNNIIDNEGIVNWEEINM